MGANLVSLRNGQCSITVDPLGGAIVDFNLGDKGVNPLNFNFQQPVKGNRNIFYKGHFLCLGRWGDPSPGETAKGLVKHGDFNQLSWDVKCQDNALQMAASSHLEGLAIKRTIALDAEAPLLLVTEKIENIHAAGRLYNVVQHPTIAAPFLSSETIVDCNASEGFDYAFDKYEETIFSTWPQVLTTAGTHIKLDKPTQHYSSVFPFIVNPKDDWGWLTAFSPEYKTLIGYVWPRAHYPWINHWLHWSKSGLQYRGLEFGTTGIHKPFKEIWENKLFQLLGEDTCRFLDAGESEQRSYFSFLLNVEESFSGVKNVQVNADHILVLEKETGNEYTIANNLKSAYGV